MAKNKQTKRRYEVVWIDYLCGEHSLIVEATDENDAAEAYWKWNHNKKRRYVGTMVKEVNEVEDRWHI